MVKMVLFHRLDNLNIKGADSFEIRNLDSDGPLSINIKNATVFVPEATFSSLYELTGVNVSDINLDLTGKGDLR